MKSILILDAHGGGVGKLLVSAIRQSYPEIAIMPVGTNSTAASVMLKACASHAATGENTVVIACRKAYIILGAAGIVIADSMYGKITPTMALAVAQSNAKRILISFNHCDNIIVGVKDYSLSALFQEAVAQVKNLFECSCSEYPTHF